ncbi:hypothetical protein BE17_31290 [Sorangium cellulosum]|uniref:Uncharacterized protein n=1 Tax=Sorangium cellulosum TaxID=56 RepID=A0A150R2C5_SORCE|nr:hypothetical protein BE17_31290 [Sorangium cellulosum]
MLNAEGWDPDDPGAYTLGESEVPWVEVPDIAEVDGAFEEGRDPHAAYADAVIAALEADVSGGAVVARADFVANARAWRENSAALEIAQRAGRAPEGVVRRVPVPSATGWHARAA